LLKVRDKHAHTRMQQLLQQLPRLLATTCNAAPAS
jgi:hypothetical protein